MENYKEKSYLDRSPNVFSYNIRIEGYGKKCGKGGSPEYTNYVAARNYFALKAYHVLQKLLVAQKKQEQRLKKSDIGNNSWPDDDTQQRSGSSYTRLSEKKPSLNVEICQRPKRLKQNVSE